MKTRRNSGQIHWVSQCIALVALLWSALMLWAPQQKLHADQPGLRWRIPGYGDTSRPIDVKVLAAQTLTLEHDSNDASAEKLVKFQCRNRETDEQATVPVSSLFVQRSPSGWTTQIRLDDTWLDLPYPIDPTAIESKPMAIIAQRSGIPVLSLPAERLRAEFASTAAYMLITAGHHYKMPFGDGQLDCTFGVGAETSPVLQVSFGRGLPDGLYPRDFSRSDASQWPTWVIGTDFDASLPAMQTNQPEQLDQLLAMQAANISARAAALRYWDDGSSVSRWILITLDSITRDNANPPRASRALGLVSAAMNDALVAGSRAMLGTYPRHSTPCAAYVQLSTIGVCPAVAGPSEDALVAGAASTVLAYLYPDQAAQFSNQADNLRFARLAAGTDYPSDYAAGWTLGVRVGQQVVARAQSDGSDAKWNKAIPSGAGWQPTPPDFQANPTEPLAGTWRTWNLIRGSQFRLGPPPLPGSVQFESDLREAYDIGHPLSLEAQEIASYWEDKKGTSTPPGHWNLIAVALVRHAGNFSMARTAQLFAVLNTAEADAFIACWDTKFTYWSVRPVTAIQRYIDVTWQPYIYTPPFPSYVSGHATGSGAAATVLGAFFPSDLVQIEQWAQQAALSRLYGGIHFRTDNEAGLALGRKVGQQALGRLQHRALF